MHISFILKVWDISRHILVEGYLVTAIKEGSAKYLAPFSPRFPHFEVSGQSVLFSAIISEVERE